MTQTPMFTLSVGGAPLDVVRFSGHEAISQLFEFRIEVVSSELDLESLLGASATLTIDSPDGPRRVHGLISEAEYVGQARHRYLYELSVTPWAHRMLHRQNCRVFQNQSTPEIVTEVLQKAGLERKMFRFSLVEAYAPRNYCVQYRETDLAFINRLLEEDGIFYFFDHEENTHVWVMADHERVHAPIPGSSQVWFSPPLGDYVRDREHVQGFRLSGRIRPGKVSLRDKNLHQPFLAMDAQAAAKSDTDLEVYDYPGEYQDPGRSGPHQGQTLARLRLESVQATRRLGTGESDCPRLTPGRMFSMLGHPLQALNADYRLVRVNHSGNQPQVLDQDGSSQDSYSNSFTVTEMKVPFRPGRTTPRPLVRGLQTATVVGPSGEEVHTDEEGRVRLQFHWDRQGTQDEQSTCWVRVSQAWAGNGYGMMFLPRIGHEVLVDFLEGDPDRPVIVGQIYHGFNKPPYPLPEEKSKSTLKTESSLGGGGYNELTFEDKKGSEQVYLRAQKDLSVQILNNHMESVGADRTTTIGNNETHTVGVDQTTTIGNNETRSVAVDRATTIGSNEALAVGSDASHVIGARLTLTIGASKTESVALTSALDIGGTYQVSVGGAVTESVGLAKMEDVGLVKLVTVGKDSIENVGMDRSVSAGKNLREAAGADLSLSAGKNISASAQKNVTVSAQKKASIVAADKLTIQCGGASVTLKKNGDVSIKAKKLNIKASGQVTVKGSKIKFN